MTTAPDHPWQRLLVGARDVAALVAQGLVAPADAADLEAVVARYQMLVSTYYLGLIDRDDPACPIRRQALPAREELHEHPAEMLDPIGDSSHAPTRILVRRYPDRALLFPTLRCPMFCRYCFRKVALNEEPIRLRHELPAALDWLRAHPEVEEVILSGGDPLMLSDALLSDLLGGLQGLGTLKRLRIHSRMPVTLPQRIDGPLARLLGGHRPLTVVAHFNHPRELTPEARQGIETLLAAGVAVLNQAVLLRGINDDAPTLARLFTGLLNWGVRPYYLHHPDLTVGTGHFRVRLEAGLALMRGLRGQISGLALPTYVIEIPGGGGKVPVDSSFVRAGTTPGLWHLESPLDGRITNYQDLAVPPAP